jgi:hypothetical protein
LQGFFKKRDFRTCFQKHGQEKEKTMKTMMKVLFVTAMALTLVYSAGAGVSYASDKGAGIGGPAYSDFVNGAPSFEDGRTPAVMGSWN